MRLAIQNALIFLPDSDLKKTLLVEFYTRPVTFMISFLFSWNDYQSGYSKLPKNVHVEFSAAEAMRGHEDSVFSCQRPS